MIHVADVDPAFARWNNHFYCGVAVSYLHLIGCLAIADIMMFPPCLRRVLIHIHMIDQRPTALHHHGPRFG